MPLSRCVRRLLSGFVPMEGSVCSKSSASIVNSSQRDCYLLQRALTCSRKQSISKLPFLHIGLLSVLERRGPSCHSLMLNSVEYLFKTSLCCRLAACLSR